MSDTQPEVLPAPEAATVPRPRHPDSPAAPGALLPDSAAEAETSAEPLPVPTRRGNRASSTAAVTVPWESALPGVRSSEIRAELVRREKRAAELLAERERVVAELEAIEAALDALGEDAP